ncbi:CEI_1a_G0033790.mRNA.1.CDS.1 [Saccharomyces cerevisiae]|nr:AMH_1a_G0033940.mRNA.1.CDS.1 [Saccharomyces cerevisiae]CAI4611566.1 CEI_1a_G0033790.mRNA.1.CDS.1 [Saccharomyces cerevisiae]CAI6779912.1 AMH_1a_G0033940.mRNA.1.CDS.1 [Saccharomyces cerevisiae]CAI7392503.1 CEI_1a_G0033790.mRNA.1.CDS.1 [Saccharomyces cerevisiae]
MTDVASTKGKHESDHTQLIESPRFSRGQKEILLDHEDTKGKDSIINSPVSGRQSISPTLSNATVTTTKSIMNVAGTSGAVVSNTPEPGLKRVPAVTFSDLKQQQKQDSLTQLKKESEKVKLPNSGSVSVPSNPAVIPTHINSSRAAQVSGYTLANEMKDSALKIVDPIKPDKIMTSSAPISGKKDMVAAKSSSSIALRKEDVNDEDNNVPVRNNARSAPEETPVKQSIIPPIITKRENSKNSDPRLPQDDGKLHVLFGATGSLSVFKTKPMIKKLEEIYGRDRISIQVILTQSATQYFEQRYTKKIIRSSEKLNKLSQYESTPITPVTTAPGQCNMAQVVELPPHIQLWTDQDEWDAWKQRTDPVLHIELRRWADILVVAPLTANTLSKIALGLCDNLLTSVIRAWNPSYPILLAPSMVSSTFNSMMTKKQLQIIKEEMSWVTVFKPSEKVMDINGDIVIR